jgi:hypothetical protein
MFIHGLVLAASLLAVDGTQGGLAARKDFDIAEFYRRTGHPASAAFYYELVTRRYSGTDIAERARGRLAEMDR